MLLYQLCGLYLGLFHNHLCLCSWLHLQHQRGALVPKSKSSINTSWMKKYRNFLWCHDILWNVCTVIHPPTPLCPACLPYCGKSLACMLIVGCAFSFILYGELPSLLGQITPGVITPHLPSWVQVQPWTWLGGSGGTIDFFSLPRPFALTLLPHKPERSEPSMTESGREEKGQHRLNFTGEAGICPGHPLEAL